MKDAGMDVFMDDRDDSGDLRCGVGGVGGGDDDDDDY